MEKEYDLGLSTEGKKVKISLGELLDIEKLFRLNPHWFVDEVGIQNPSFTAELKDYESDEEFQLSGNLISNSPELFELEFDSGVLRSFKLFFRDEILRGTLVFREDEPEPELEQQYLLWLRGIKEYLRLYNTTTLNTRFFRVVMNKMVLNMNPSQRKICLMLVRLTVVEIFVILLIVIGYTIFVLK